MGIERPALGVNLTADIDDRLSVAGGERVARAAAVPGDGKAPLFPEDARKFSQRLVGSKPVKRLGTEDEVNALRREPSGLGPSCHPRDVRVGCRGAPHGFPRLDGDHANPMFAEQTRRDSSPRSDIGGDELPGGSEAAKNGVNRFRGIAWTISDVVIDSIVESPNGLAIEVVCQFVSSHFSHRGR